MTCRDCKFLGIKRDKLGRRLPRKGTSYPCLAPLPPQPVMPASMPGGHIRRRGNEPELWWADHQKWHMEPDEGADCRLHTALDAEPPCPPIGIVSEPKLSSR